MLTRRGLLGGLGGAVSAKRRSTGRPNLVFVLADDHAGLRGGGAEPLAPGTPYLQVVGW